MPKPLKPKVIAPPAPTAPGGAPRTEHVDAVTKENAAGKTRFEVRCPTCGTMTVNLTRCPVDGRLVE